MWSYIEPIMTGRTKTHNESYDLYFGRRQCEESLILSALPIEVNRGKLT